MSWKSTHTHIEESEISHMLAVCQRLLRCLLESSGEPQKYKEEGC